MKGKRMACLLLCGLLAVPGTLPALAAEQEAVTAGESLRQKGVLTGDAAGNLMLDKGLTRAELAAILVRLDGGAEKVAAAPKDYAWYCYFADVPEWAKPYVGYCADRQLMVGYDLFHFGAEDSVDANMACTVTLRYLETPETDWNYGSSVNKATTLGLTPALNGGAVTRGDMAVLLNRALTKADAPPVVTTPAPGGTSAGSSKENPKVLDGRDWAREDFSQQANPAIFDSVYTRAAYNAIRQTIVDRDAILAGNNAEAYNSGYTYGYTSASSETARVMDQILPRFSRYHWYSQGVEPYLTHYQDFPYYFICKVEKRAEYAEAVANLSNTVAELKAFNSDAERVRKINDIVCDKLTYKEDGYAMPLSVFTSTGVSQANCAGYARTFLFLCDLTEVPCITLSSHNHDWNAVYVDGTWSFVDVVVNDIGDELEYRDCDLMVASLPDVSHVDAYPQITAFAKELLVPSSTK